MEASSSSSSVISSEDVLECLMNDGTIDALGLKIINQLKANEELKNTTIKMAEQSKVLNTHSAEKQTKRELFDALRQELEDKENKEETEKEEELTIASMKEKSLLKHPKKRHTEVNMEKGGAANEVARKSVDDRSSKSPHSKTLNLS
ncbi:unnamed protein product [Linum trigynum]|uniref:Uncharacterized protein n=1 Tax=Linum trigynum TaxID=586398 RepID=A0AAV2GAJ4_9ROSI